MITNNISQNQENCNSLQVFNNPDFGQVRTVLLENAVWFIAVDVCTALEIQNAAQAVDRLEEDEVTMFNIGGLSGNVNIINEAGLYSLVLGSRKPEARTFKRWITHEVIPAIRKNGTYSIKPMTPAEILAGQAQLLVEMERKVLDIERKFDNAVEAITTASKTTWREDMNNRINKMCLLHGLNYQTFRGDLYKELEGTAACNLESRKTRLKSRLDISGATYRERQAITKLDVIERDPKLKAIFESIVRKYQLKYSA